MVAASETVTLGLSGAIGGAFTLGGIWLQQRFRHTGARQDRYDDLVGKLREECEAEVAELKGEVEALREELKAAERRYLETTQALTAATTEASTCWMLARTLRERLPHDDPDGRLVDLLITKDPQGNQ